MATRPTGEDEFSVMALLLRRVIGLSDFPNAAADGVPMLEHVLQRSLTGSGDAVIAPRRAGRRRLRSYAELALACEACQKGIDSAFGKRKTVVVGEKLDQLVAVRFSQLMNG